jgi:arylsulfatase A-like enzyme
MKSVGKLWKAQSPSYFTYPSHAAFFVGFLPTVYGTQERFINPEYGRLFALNRSSNRLDLAGFKLTGRSLAECFNNLGYNTSGSGAMGWFNPNYRSADTLTRDYNNFFWVEGWGALEQIHWTLQKAQDKTKPAFSFINFGETHSPYWYANAPWDRTVNPCHPKIGDIDECILRQRMCVEYIDSIISPLLDRFKDGTIVICADHGDNWGEDGIWGHTVNHSAVLEVPLIIRSNK